MDGYMISVEYDEQNVRIHPKNSAARFAMTGAKSTLKVTDAGKYRVDTKLGDLDVTLPRADIASATFKGANMLTNGNLTLTAADGARYQLHFRRKQQAGFETLATALGAPV